MSDDRALKSWVSDQLHGLLGFAEGNLASYVVGLGALTTSTMTNIIFPFFAKTPYHILQKNMLWA